MELHAGKRAPVELEGRPRGVHLRRSAVHAAEDVELVVMQIDRNRIVGLVGRALRPQPRHGKDESSGQSQPCAVAGDFHRRSLIKIQREQNLPAEVMLAPWVRWSRQKLLRL